MNTQMKNTDADNVTGKFRFGFNHDNAKQDKGRFVVRIYTRDAKKWSHGEYFHDTFLSIESGHGLQLRSGSVLTPEDVAIIQMDIREHIDSTTAIQQRLNITGIRKLLGVSSNTALKIEDTIDSQFCLDYSECSKAEFNRAAREAYNMLKEGFDA
jgi:hypothetical protein